MGTAILKPLKKQSCRNVVRPTPGPLLPKIEQTLYP
jgi:hypothetical protein